MWVEVKHRLTLLILISSCFCVYRFPSVPFSNNTFDTFCLYGLELNIIYVYVTINRFHHLFNTSFLPFSVCGSQLLLKMEIFKNTLLTSPKNNFANVTKNRRDSFISWGLFSAADGSTFCFSGGFFTASRTVFVRIKQFAFTIMKRRVTRCDSVTHPCTFFKKQFLNSELRGRTPRYL